MAGQDPRRWARGAQALARHRYQSRSSWGWGGRAYPSLLDLPQDAGVQGTGQAGQVCAEGEGQGREGTAHSGAGPHTGDMVTCRHQWPGPAWEGAGGVPIPVR